MKTVKTVKEVLECARDCIAKGWTQHAYARNAAGETVNLLSENACKFCALGAIEHCAPGGVSYAYYDARTAVHDVIEQDLVQWNDMPGRTQREVVAAFDKAITRVQ